MTLTYENEGDVIVAGYTWIFPTMQTPRRWLSQIMDEAAEIYGVTVKDIKGRSRQKQIVRARHYVCYQALKDGSLQQTRIGQLLGGRDHSTVIHGAYAHAVRHRLPHVTNTRWTGPKNQFSYEGPEPTR